MQPAMDITSSWLDSYLNDELVSGHAHPASRLHACHDGAGGASLTASTSAASTSQTEAPRTVAKDRKARACDACRIRRIKCQRTEALSDSCSSCLRTDIRCVTSKPHVRTSQKGARIAQARMIYGDASGSDSNVMAVRIRHGLLEQSRPRTPSATEVAMIASMDASLLLGELVPAVAKLQVAKFPLLRWVDIANEFRSANGHLSNMDGENQALFLSLAALSARTSPSKMIIGPNAPELQQVSQDPELRRGSTLCEFGKRRERLASELLQVAYRRINENQLLSKPSLRSIAALATVETLILVYQDSLAFTKSASRNARPFAAAAASHIRILADEGMGQLTDPLAFYSVAWTAFIRDALVASVTGRALDFTSSDVFMILEVDEEAPIDLPSPNSLVDCWIENGLLEGPKLMLLWTCLLKLLRKFVTDVTQPLAVRRPRLKLETFGNFYSTLKQCRDVFAEALLLLQATNIEPPVQRSVFQYCTDFMLAQAHRVILWRCSVEELARARVAPLSATSGRPNQNNFEAYKIRLETLRTQSTEEAFQAARRVMKSIGDTLASQDAASADFFSPGYFTHEGLPVWISLLVDTRTLEDGGRVDYSLWDKIGDLKILREGIAITGWSSGQVQPHLEYLDTVISNLETQQITNTVPPACLFSEFVNFSPIPQEASYRQLAQQPYYQASESSSGSFITQGSSFSRDSQASIQEILQGPTPPDLWNYGNGMVNAFTLQDGRAQVEPSALDMGQLPSAEYIDQFLKSIGFSAPLADNANTSSL